MNWDISNIDLESKMSLYINSSVDNTFFSYKNDNFALLEMNFNILCSLGDKTGNIL